MNLPSEILVQLVVQFPVVAILMYLLFRLDRRMADLIGVICQLAGASLDQVTLERIDRYLGD